ncbi:MAG TPA: metallophosphoesterase family protein [Ktedonosporobacter sp.]|jgi:diadenosine tetraphosphatase ApaH/serine/threonine PP2A family protein phosphatase|nr:metallophosphoesterase family protein [Ktedonosporobacter sp.]
MRYAIFTDVHANLEALEAVLAKIDEIAQEEPIDAIWFLGDLVGYGPNPNECITTLRERTDVIIAGNHDWAAVGKIDLEDFSEAARISAEWTAAQLTDEHREFLANLPERIDMPDCLLVHGSPYGPLWEYLTSEILAERSFQYFYTRYCLVGHTHVPVIFQQADTFANTPTMPLSAIGQNGTLNAQKDKKDDQADKNLGDDETTEMAAIRPTMHASRVEAQPESAAINADPLQAAAELADARATVQQQLNDGVPAQLDEVTNDTENVPPTDAPPDEDSEETTAVDAAATDSASENVSSGAEDEEESEEDKAQPQEAVSTTPEEVILSAEDRINQEIEELLSLLGLSQSMVKVTNEMIIPPIGEWRPPDNYRAIINPGGVGQPRDGDPRAAFMIYDTERGFTFYRIPYDFEKTQEKIMKAGLPQYLATRLAYGR